MNRMICFATSVALVATVFVGCEKSEPAKPEAVTKDGGVSVKLDVPSPAVALLAAADAVDGKTDKVVSKCPGCALSMDGKSEHKLEAHGYAMHFCAAGCKDTFAKDVEKNILALKVPAK